VVPGKLVLLPFSSSFLRARRIDDVENASARISAEGNEKLRIASKGTKITMVITICETAIKSTLPSTRTFLSIEKLKPKIKSTGRITIPTIVGKSAIGKTLFAIIPATIPQTTYPIAG